MGYTQKFVEEVIEYNAMLPSDDNTTFYHRLNHITVEYTSYCNASLTVYIETLIPAALRLFITLIDFDDGDVIRWIYRPRGLGTRGRHGRAGLLNRLTRPIGLKEIEGRKTTEGVKTLWRLDNVGQKIFLWWLIAEASVAFVYDWTTLLKQSGGCQQGSGVADTAGGILITNGAFQGANYPLIRSSILPVTMSPTGASMPASEMQAVANLKCEGTNGLFDTTVTIRILMLAGGVPNYTSTSFNVPKSGKGEGVVSAYQKNCTFIGVDVKTEGSAVNVLDGSLVVTLFDNWNK